MKHKSLTILFIIAAAVLAAYLCTALYFKGHFFPGSTVNGISSSGATAETVKAGLQKQAANYILAINERGGKREMISSADAGLTLDLSQGQVEKLLADQNAFAWPAAIFQKKAYTSDTLSEVDGAKLKSAVDALSCVTDPEPTESLDATYAYANGAYSISDEVYGTKLDPDTLLSAVRTAMEHFDDAIDLDEDRIYIQPAVTKDTPELVSLVDELNKRLSMKVAYTTGDVIDKDTMAGFLSADENMKLTVNADAVSEYVSSLAKKYNTAGRSKTLTTQYGTTVTVPGGSYGWQVNRSEEAAKLTEEIEKGEDVSRDITWSRTAASHGENDYGNSYVEVNLTAQHVFLIVNGQRVLDSPAVTGNVSKEWMTPAGAYFINYCARDVMLKGESHVDYWMPFNGNIGLHDAAWRSHFGGADYLTKGSHGCVNLPTSFAPKLFKYVSAGFPVLVYTLPGTETYDAAGAANVTNLINSIGTVTASSGPAISAARSAYDALDGDSKKAIMNLKTLTAAETAYAEIPQTGGTAVAAGPGQ